MIRILRAALLTVLLSIPSGAGAVSFDAVYFFGDSISDTGNHLAIFNSPLFSPTAEKGYYQGRWQAGPAWPDYFADLVGGDSSSRGAIPLPAGTNYAIGGSISGLFDGESGPLNPALFGGSEEIFYLPSQINTFFSDFPGGADPDALYSLQIGSNDVPLGLRSAADGPNAAGNLLDEIVRLRDAGAQHFLIANLGLFGLNVEADAFAAGFNDTLGAGLSALVDDGLDVALFDMASFVATFDFSPFILANCVDDSLCQQGAIAAAMNGEPFEHDSVSFDGTHFNTKIHEQIAMASAAALEMTGEPGPGPGPGPGPNPIPEPGIATLMLGGLALLAARRRRGIS